ncbi:MAG: hypothetical protein ACJAZ9_000217 [Neolewinella sp.]|jgi:hypothetical protein
MFFLCPGELLFDVHGCNSTAFRQKRSAFSLTPLLWGWDNWRAKKALRFNTVRIGCTA